MGSSFDDPNETWGEYLKRTKPDSMWLKKDPYDFSTPAPKQGENMNLEDILECLNDGYEYDSYNRTIVPAALAQGLILEAASLHKTCWIKSTERLPEMEKHCVLVYSRGSIRVAYLVFVAGNDPKSGYRWVYVDGDSDYQKKIDDTYWMPLPKPPKGE